MDELGLRVPHEGGVQRLADILNFLNQKCKMVWIIPSSTNLVDQSDLSNKNTINKSQFADLMEKVDIQYINLTNIFRNSMNISKIVPAGEFNKFRNKNSDKKEPTAIPGGQCSTIVGTRPTAVIYSWNDAYNYKMYADIIVKYITQCFSDSIRIAILCDRQIEPRKVLSELTNFQASEIIIQVGGIKYYDGGVKEFNGDGIPIFDETSVDTKEVEEWIHFGGLLLTHDRLFNGAEADIIIIVSSSYGGTTTNIRSCVTRAVRDCCSQHISTKNSK